jgi:hypothetical protein
MRFLFSSLAGIFHLLRDFFYFMCGFRHFPATGLLLLLFLDCFVCFEAVTVTGKNESGAFFPDFLRGGCNSNCGKMEDLCHHREKYAEFQQRRKGKWRLMQPARRPVIANPQGEAIHTGMLDGFASYLATLRPDDRSKTAPSLRTRRGKQSMRVHWMSSSFALTIAVRPPRHCEPAG